MCCGVLLGWLEAGSLMECLVQFLDFCVCGVLLGLHFDGMSRVTPSFLCAVESCWDGLRMAF